MDSHMKSPFVTITKVLHLTYMMYWIVLLENSLYVDIRMVERSNKSQIAAILTISKDKDVVY